MLFDRFGGRIPNMTAQDRRAEITQHLSLCVSFAMRRSTRLLGSSSGAVDRGSRSNFLGRARSQPPTAWFWVAGTGRCLARGSGCCFARSTRFACESEASRARLWLRFVEMNRAGAAVWDPGGRGPHPQDIDISVDTIGTKGPRDRDLGTDRSGRGK